MKGFATELKAANHTAKDENMIDIRQCKFHQATRWCNGTMF